MEETKPSAVIPIVTFRGHIWYELCSEPGLDIVLEEVSLDCPEQS